MVGKLYSPFPNGLEELRLYDEWRVGSINQTVENCIIVMATG